jgi:hypothetical protein
MTAARMSWISRVLSRTTYSVGLSSCPSHVIGPATGGASLSGMEKEEALLCRLSLEDLALSKGDAMVWGMGLELGFCKCCLSSLDLLIVCDGSGDCSENDARYWAG